MSRYVLQHPTEPNIKIVVGWDNPLQTYFFQRINESKDEDDENRINPWRGLKPGEIPFMDDLVEQVNPYFVLSAELRAKLRNDKTSSGQRTPLQQQMLDVLLKR